MSALYIHIPFCSSKCPYCDFFSQVGTPRQLDGYVDLLKLNLTILKRDFPDTSAFDTIFFGGGTPSLLSVAQLAALLSTIQNHFDINPEAEITLEANPGTVDSTKLEGYRNAGVNRLSLGIQSLNDYNLQALGRIHTAGQARECVVAARQAGFDNLSLDLIFALPGQTLSGMEREITNLLELKPEHISLYGLSFEEGTDFFKRLTRGELKACDENVYAEQYKMIHRELSRAGFEHYEISNFALPGFRCRHNQIYWQRRNCLAIGCGAHSFIERNWGERWHIPGALTQYQAALTQGMNPAEQLEVFDRSGAMKEFIYLALRTKDGLSAADFLQRFGERPDKSFSLAFAKTSRYLQQSDSRWHFDPEAWLLYDHLITHFL